MDGVIKAAAGETTLDEVLRSTQDVEASHASTATRFAGLEERLMTDQQA